MRVPAADLRDVERQPSGLRERLEEVRIERRVEATDGARRGLEVVREVRPAAQVDGDVHEALVHRDRDRGIAGDPFAASERGVQRAPEREADVLHGVVLIHVEVAFRLQREVEQPVHGDELEHVIEERQARSDIGLAFPIEPQGDLDVGLLALSHLSRGARAHRRAAGAANTFSRAAMKRPFSAGMPMETRRQPWQPGHIEMSRMSTLWSRKRACAPAVSPSFTLKRMKFVTDGKASIAPTLRSAAYTRSRSVRQSSIRRAIEASSFAIFAATACVSALTLYGSCTARNISATVGCVRSTPTRRPADARTFEKVLLMTMFGCAASSGRSVVRAKSLYASSTRTSVSG